METLADLARYQWRSDGGRRGGNHGKMGDWNL